ncbi:tRNA pseudouridine(38-40) synthase TruA [Virgibacillus sp. NKC19-16]|uniref:tRNA pseudouridine(38-40) synthase TruA n=1 Tax=Virgibacillus salidurans TaxID=2831673 RepID=UPI001F2514C6|nr:tRNA pseudouridine(38-40) synthase TruA [Virgibacillus sp. NKC19-16]UJL46576.1 tRNA pseudouridine(38-40) synthase TruA [Virgibacillus sp. NKC19-16]
MQKVKCIITYDGSGFAGFQIQPKQRTVQGELEKALTKMHKGSYVRVHPSGRTDTGVHAINQTIHFETLYDIPVSNWKRAINTLLPGDLYVKEVKLAHASFHARYDVVEKEYRYYIWNEKEADVFKRNYFYQFPYSLNVEAIQEACKQLEGKHDFTTFSSAKATTKGSKERTLYQVTCEKRGSELELIFRGSGFLYNMVRIIVGVLLDIGQERREPAEIAMLLDSKDRRLVGETVPPQGLYLWDVKYED